jgi:hypothetical protein
MRYLVGLLFLAASTTALAAEPEKIRMANSTDLWPAYLASACAQRGANTMLYGMTMFPYGFVDSHTGAVGFVDCVDGKLAPFVPKTDSK